eukprot:5693357-Pyramimonas_sp.AAC.1
MRSAAPVWTQTFFVSYGVSWPVVLERPRTWPANCLRPTQLAGRDDVSQLRPHFLNFRAAD